MSPDAKVDEPGVDQAHTDQAHTDQVQTDQAGTDEAGEASEDAERYINLTSSAADKVRSFLEDESDVEDVALRVAVQAGGCAGFRYALFFDDRSLDGDLVEDHHGITIRVDKMSKPYLSGVTIDWKESLEASGFAIDNPNEGGSCACGESATF